MARVFAITTTATSLRLDAQGRAETSFTVSNASGRALRGRAQVRADNSTQQDWFSIGGDVERDYPAHGTHQITVRMAAPPGSPAGRSSFRLDVVSAQNPDEDFAEGPTVTFEVPAPAPKKPFPWWIVAVAAAVVLLVGGLTAYLMMREPAPPAQEAASTPAPETPAAPPSRVTLESLVGSYRRDPVENAWHEGRILPAGDSLTWTNNAGTSWKLIPDLGNLILKTDATNPYANTGPRDFAIVMSNDRIEGFRFGSDLYRRVASATPPSAGPEKLSLTGPGGAVPDGNGGGASFEITVSDPRTVAAAGNNVTVTFIGVNHGAIVDLIAQLEHVGYGPPLFLFDRVLNIGTFICVADFTGTYTFSSAESGTVRSQCGNGGVGGQPGLIPPGAYMTAMPDDVTNSNLSAAWNGKPVAGVWRLKMSDNNVNTGANQFVMNANWSWRLDINVVK